MNNKSLKPASEVAKTPIDCRHTPSVITLQVTPAQAQYILFMAKRLRGPEERMETRIRPLVQSLMRAGIPDLPSKLKGALYFA